MSSGVIKAQEILNHDNRLINCGELSRDEMNRCLREMSYASIKNLSLVDFNHFKSKNMMDASEHYIFLGYSAVLKNRYIEQLTLSNEFVQRFYNSDGISTVIEIQALIRMRSLVKLSLHNENWDDDIFKGLRRYLIDKHCTLQTLELKNEISAADFDELKKTIMLASSLRNYIGPFQLEAQAILDEK